MVQEVATSEITRRPSNYPCQTIVYTLMFQYILESNIMKKGITIVKCVANKSRCNGFIKGTMWSFTGLNFRI